MLNNLKLSNIYKKLGIKKNDNLYVTGNFGRLGFFESCDNFNNYQLKKINTFSQHYNILKKIIGKDGTIFFPTHSWSLVKNKDIIFDVKKTPCDYAFSEYLRTNKKSFRFFHPFNSISGVGKNAKKLEIMKNKNSYGKNTPFDLIAQLNSKHLSIGIKANITCTEVHHCEYLAKVPYRYLKKFEQKCLIDKSEVTKNFYLYVWKKSQIIERDKNLKIFKKNKIKNLIKIENYENVPIELFDIKSFIKFVTNYMKEDPYIWTRSIKNK